MNFINCNMGNKDKDQSTKKEYTLDDLRKDINNQFDAEEQKDGEEKMRDKLLYLKVLNYLMDIVELAKEDSEEDRNAHIRLILEKDNAIFGYTYFLTSKNQFDYSWSYLRNQWSKYIELLGYVCVFVRQMLTDIGHLQGKGKEVFDKKVVFTNVFIASFERHEPTVEVLWENIDNLFDVKNGYSVTIQVGKVVLLSAFCKYHESGLDDLWKKHLKIAVKHDKEAQNN